MKSKAIVHLGKDDAGFAIRKIDLMVTATVDGIDADEFTKVVEGVECPISKALASTNIVITANLENA